MSLMAEVIGILAAAVIVLIFSLVRVLRLQSSKYDEGFGVGALAAFLWVRNNTTFKDIFNLYESITEEDPDDGLYICERNSKGMYVIKRGTKMISFSGR